MYYNYYPFYYGYEPVREEKRAVHGTRYIVEPGDQLYQIAERFHTTVDYLKEINNLTSSTIYPGDIILVDDKFSPDKIEDVYQDYVVKDNETIYSIAYLFNMTVFELKALNNLLADELSPGQVITVKNIPEKISRNITHIVKSGDNLYEIAKKYRTTVENIKRLNNLTSNLIYINQELVVFNGNDGKHLKTYTVRPGDSLYNIAKSKNTTVSELKKLNNMHSNLLKIGEQLVIPD